MTVVCGGKGEYDSGQQLEQVGASLILVGLKDNSYIDVQIIN